MVWATYHSLPTSCYQLFMNLDPIGFEVSVSKGGDMFPPRDTKTVSLNWDFKFLPGLYWAPLKETDKNRITVLFRVTEPDN